MNNQEERYTKRERKISEIKLSLGYLLTAHKKYNKWEFLCLIVLYGETTYLLNANCYAASDYDFKLNTIDR